LTVQIFSVTLLSKRPRLLVLSRIIVRRGLSFRSPHPPNVSFAKHSIVSPDVSAGVLESYP
jgi:hypothetical protein